MTRTSASVRPEQAHQRLRSWFVDDVLPVWADTGRDEPGWGFHEHLGLDGRPTDVAFKRTRVQARQLYVFSHAFMTGTYPDLSPAADAFAFLLGHAQREDGAWVRAVGRRGGVLDPAADLYDLAFVLFALAWYYRASGDPHCLVLADRTLAFIRRKMTAESGGFLDVLPREAGHRRQNPHMHLLEAALALHAVSDHEVYADLAISLVRLFTDRWHHAETGTLGEFFDDALAPVRGDGGNHVEPGHHYEWVWLLDQHARLLGLDILPEAESLYRFAERHGRVPGEGGICDVISRDGRMLNAASRVWPQTEALKAHIAMARRGHDTAARVEHGVEHLFERHLRSAPRGMWLDHVAPDGRLLVDKVPASSLYHLFLAFAEVDAAVVPGATQGALVGLRRTGSMPAPIKTFTLPVPGSPC